MQTMNETTFIKLGKARVMFLARTALANLEKRREKIFQVRVDQHNAMRARRWFFGKKPLSRHEVERYFIEHFGRTPRHYFLDEEIRLRQLLELTLQEGTDGYIQLSCGDHDLLRKFRE